MRLAQLQQAADAQVVGGLQFFKRRRRMEGNVFQIEMQFGPRIQAGGFIVDDEQPRAVVERAANQDGAALSDVRPDCRR